MGTNPYSPGKNAGQPMHAEKNAVPRSAGLQSFAMSDMLQEALAARKARRRSAV